MHRMQIGSAGILKIVCLIFYLFVLRQSASSLRQFILVFKKKKKGGWGENQETKPKPESRNSLLRLSLILDERTHQMT